MRKIVLYVALLITTGTSHASLSTNLVGLPQSRVSLNVACYGLLAMSHDSDPGGAIARLRDHRVRTLNGAAAEARYTKNLKADDRSGARALNELSAHLRGIERWTMLTGNPVYGLVFRGPDAIAAHLIRLDEVRNLMTAAIRGDSRATNEVTKYRAGLNFVNSAALLLPAVQPSVGSWAIASVALVLANPIATNHALFIQDRSIDRFEDRVGEVVRRGDSQKWIFASRIYSVHDVFAQALGTNNLEKLRKPCGRPKFTT